MIMGLEDILQKKAIRDDLILKIEIWKTSREKKLLKFLGEDAAFVQIYKAYEADILAAQAKLYEIEMNCEHEVAELIDSEHERCIVCDRILTHYNLGITRERGFKM